jgi:hypothetical protein
MIASVFAGARIARRRLDALRRHLQFSPIGTADLWEKPESATLDFVESTNPAHLEPLTPDIRRRVAHTCEQVAAGLSTLAYEIVREIRTEIPDYALVPVREHQEWVTDTARVLLAGIAEQQLPRPEHVRHARELGRQRARQGLAIELLLGAYHITYRETGMPSFGKRRPKIPNSPGAWPTS